MHTFFDIQKSKLRRSEDLGKYPRDALVWKKENKRIVSIEGRSTPWETAVVNPPLLRRR
jgi:hypothetical protein